MKRRSAIKIDLFAAQLREEQIDHWGEPLAGLEACIDFQALARAMDKAAPRAVNAQGGRPAYPTETLVRILVLKRLNNRSDERMEFLLLARRSYQRFCGLTQALHGSDRTTLGTFENRIGEAGATALFEGVTAQLLRKGLIARGGQMIDAMLVPAPRQKIIRKEKEIIDQQATPSDWQPAQRRQKDTAATWTQKHGKRYYSQPFDNVFEARNTSRAVSADRGYPSKEREGW